MTKITAETAVTIPEHVLTRNLDGELVMLNLENERYYGLDDIGTHCWEALETSANLAQAYARFGPGIARCRRFFADRSAGGRTGR